MPISFHTSAAPARTIACGSWCAGLLARWRSRRQMQALAALEPLDRRAVLQDAGLTEGDLPALARGGHVQSLLPAALALHGLDGTTLEAEQGNVMRDLARVCMHCRKARACALLLAGGNREDHGSICPNAPTMDSLDQH
ncbi:hypothetical protein [Azospirillum ramasamyi]|uniref:DUF1127 domain-containing protein n=1 Tax=Azospirillum ramasamyi TaxID=682998 RepID=A0A2U9SHL0_9PROT|nr:hypothetical protein [Azospirillum ramasamyi]AWU96909.1 hypothetical protein DM194_21855 [Azospirillum ramasamyi]